MLNDTDLDIVVKQGALFRRVDGNIGVEDAIFTSGHLLPWLLILIL